MVVDHFVDIKNIHPTGFPDFKRFPFPPELKKYKPYIVHEAGHATMALAHGRPVLGYYIGEDISWWDKGVVPRKFEPGDAAAVLWSSKGLTRDSDVSQQISAAGAASEMIFYDAIQSDAAMQESDRQHGGYENFYEIQQVADQVADLLESTFAPLYFLVLSRLCSHQGFSDINAKLKQGVSPLELVQTSP